MSDKKVLSDDEIEKVALKNAFADYYQKKTGDNYNLVANQAPQFNTPAAPSTVEPDVFQPPLIQQTKPTVQQPQVQYEQQPVTPVTPKMEMPKPPQDYHSTMTMETDPDLMIAYEVVSLPSQGKFYPDGLKEVKMEYLTSKDEDILTTPSLIEDGTVLNVILKRKIKTPNVDPLRLLTGDKNALILFLRASSYGQDYDVQVTDPRTGKPFKQTVDLTKLKYITGESPDDMGEFKLELPMRKKMIKFRLLTSGEEVKIEKNAEAIQEAYGQEYSEHSTMKIKAHIVEIDGKRDRSYIDKFVNAMPLKDVYTLRKEINRVTPNVDMNYQFTASDGYKFNANMTVGIDFFFPSL